LCSKEKDGLLLISKERRNILMKKMEWVVTLSDAKLVEVESWDASVIDSRGRGVVGMKCVNK
jgi:hypothetical protein